MQLLHRRYISTFAASALVLAGGLIAASPASAAACSRGDGISYAADYAWTNDLNGACGTVGVRALFYPPGTTTSVTTPWYYGDNIAQTITLREISFAWHSNSAG